VRAKPPPVPTRRPSFSAGIAIQTLLQHPEFVYRIDSGTSVEGMGDVIRLDDWAVASRLFG